ncbi:WD domain, G-beta repeat containing protein, putative [Babesia bigemina]|uniref:WD domain, G-beta repeat containing protein, putative n=1 Tax=Babesia bigemina TaxID=5866 RepID=A0A061D3S7_BABBI|nr:WD domain, G-beta repeat containing protein, putative [Babesia bigemina]CDR95361.1 WD domain, G-beta repeat containing protein, putative [Babesia bigemina]|eukprot:XP_012767547.1 WD domain, G-beta repeat containing protein, putative [Babesia bigemina]
MDTLTPFTATYRLRRLLTSCSGGTRCGCVLQGRVGSPSSGVPETSRDSEILVTGGNEGHIGIWILSDDGNVDLVNEFIGHDGIVMDLIGSCVVDSRIESEDSPHEGAGKTVSGISLSFYTCGRDRMIHRFDLSGRKLMTFKGHEDVVCSMQEFSNGRDLVSGSWDGTAIVWDALTGAIKYRLGGNPYKYSVYCNTKSDGTILTGMTNGDVCCWENGRLGKAQRVHDGVVRAISVKDNTILTCSNDCSVRKYSDDMDLIYTIPAAHQNFVYDVRHSNNFPIFFTSSEDKQVGIWDLSNGILLHLLSFESSIWKVGYCLQPTHLQVVETQRQGIIIIPLNGSISLWQLAQDSTTVLNAPQVKVVEGPTLNVARKAIVTGGSFEMIMFRQANGVKALERLTVFNRSKSSAVGLHGNPEHCYCRFVFQKAILRLLM